jgi:hypothetical protein
LDTVRAVLIAEPVIELTDHAGFARWPTTRAAGSGNVPLHAGTPGVVGGRDQAQWCL